MPHMVCFENNTADYIAEETIRNLFCNVKHFSVSGKLIRNNNVRILAPMGFKMDVSFLLTIEVFLLTVLRL